MIDCVWRLNGDGKLQCANCGWVYPREPSAVSAKWPKRNCTNPPDLRPAADKLDYPSDVPMLPGLAQHLAIWMAAGYPERDGWERFVFDFPCEHRRPSGTCGAHQCPNGDPGKHLMCHWLRRMATASCPKQHFACEVNRG